MTSDAIRRPPSSDSLGTGTVLALLAHVGLIAALAWGVSWRRHDTAPVAAELWSAVPQVADAPAPPPPPPPPPAPEPKPQPAPKPAPEPKPAPQKTPDADIATAKKEKARKEQERLEEQRQEEQRRKDAAKKEADKKAAEKKAADEKKAAEDKKAAEKKAADDKRKAADEARDKAERAEKAAREKADAERARQLREDQMRRLNQQLQGSGGSGSGGGTAAQSSGPSASYAGRIKARIRPNIILTTPVSGNPRAEVQVRVAPDGTIVGSRLTKSSGVPEWDQAVLRAIERTEVLPRDVDGRVPPEITIEFTPNDR